MKIRTIILSLTVAGLALAQSTQAQDATTTSTNATEVAFKTLIQQINADIKDGKTSETELAPEIKQFDALLADEKGATNELGAKILYMKGALYVQVIKDFDKARAVFQQIKTDYPNTKPGATIDKQLAMLDKQAAAQKIQDGLVKGAAFPDFNETDVTGQPLSVANYKGKVVLVDFWATWCAPCRGELPNVVSTYGKYHDKGFEIIGVSLDSEKDKLTSFTKDNNMTWSQYFDGKGWGNKLAAKYGVQAIPFTVLVDGNGNIIGTNLRGEELTKAVATAVGG